MTGRGVGRAVGDPYSAPEQPGTPLTPGEAALARLVELVPFHPTSRTEAQLHNWLASVLHWAGWTIDDLEDWAHNPRGWHT